MLNYYRQIRSTSGRRSERQISSSVSLPFGASELAAAGRISRRQVSGPGPYQLLRIARLLSRGPADWGRRLGGTGGSKCSSRRRRTLRSRAGLQLQIRRRLQWAGKSPERLSNLQLNQLGAAYRLSPVRINLLLVPPLGPSVYICANLWIGEVGPDP